jgi:RNA polymerase sigma-70 factor (ECF subfamily)
VKVRTTGRDAQAREVIAETLDTQQVPESDLVRLMNDYERPIYNFLLTLVRDGDVALDCTQDTFLRAYENLCKGRPVNAGWLYKVARNRAMDEFRKKRRVQPDQEELEQIAVHHHTDRQLAVRQVLDQLSSADREVLYLFDVAGFKTDEIGRMLGVRGSAIRQRLSRARERFRLLSGAEAI